MPYLRHSHSETVLNSDLLSFRRKEKPPWRQILYEQQPYEDNYVGKDFLQAIILNAHVQPYDYFTCVRESSVVCQQISLICIFVIAYAHSLSDMLPVDFLIGTECFFLIAGYALGHLSGKNFSFENVLKDLFTTFVLTSILLGLSPLLQTLTDQFSNDTITALIIILLIVHAFTHDYAYVNGYSDRFNYDISLNSVIFVSVIFASKLPTAVHSFAIIALCILLFGLFPMLRHKLKKWSPDFYLTLTWLLFCVTFSLLLVYSTILTWAYVIACIVITYIVPLLLIYIQQYKKEIEGPWDLKEPGDFAKISHNRHLLHDS